MITNNYYDFDDFRCTEKLMAKFSETVIGKIEVKLNIMKNNKKGSALC